MNMQSKNIKKSILIITGMHRSGTSLTASLLQSAGLYIGERLMGGAFSNVKGHFENLDFVEFHERILDSQGLSKAGWTLENDIFVPEEYIEKAKLLLEKNHSKTIWGWKNPRTTLFLNFWAELVPRANFLFVYRSPSEVIDSLYRRGDEIFYENPAFAIELWMHYNRNVINFYKKYPHRCTILSIYTVTKKPELLLKTLEQKFNIGLGKLKKDIYEEKLLKTLVNNHSELIKHLFPEAFDIYSELNSKAEYTNDRDAFSFESDYSASIKELCLGDWLKLRWKEKEADKYKSQLQHVQKELTDSQTQLQYFRKELNDSQTQLKETQTELNDSQTQLKETQTELNDSQTQLKETQTELNDSQTQLKGIQIELTDSQIQLQQTQSELDNCQSQLQKNQAELNTSQLQLQQTKKELEESQSEIRQIEEELFSVREREKAILTSKLWKLRTAYIGFIKAISLK